MKISVLSASQISIQKPLTDDWMREPIFYNQRYVQAQEPDYRPFISPMTARRMGKLLKRALATSLKAVNDAQITELDAVVTGTGLGCIANTEHFLSAMTNNGEQFLQPTFFMQSTHNTISSQVALQLQCHGYNNTYSHLGISFESALYDVLLQFYADKLTNALVGGHDEMTPDYFDMLDKAHLWKKGEISTDILHHADSIGSYAGETAVSLVLANSATVHPMCVIEGMDLLYNPTRDRMLRALKQLLSNAGVHENEIDAIFIGADGDARYDFVYRDFCSDFFPNVPIAWFKHLFGESYTAGGLGVYTAAVCLREQFIPDFLYYSENKVNNLHHILIYNQFQNKEHSLILLSNA